MKWNGPLLTLLAVAVLGGTLLTLSSLNNPANNNSASSAAPAASSAAAQPPAAAGNGAAPSAAPAAGQPPVIQQGTFAGRTPGKEMTVAIAVKDGRAVAYICDGKKIEAWMEGTLSGDQLSLKNKDGSATITGTVSQTAATGTITAAGRQLPFQAQGVNGPGGLYNGRADVRGVSTRIGWVVENDGTTTGIAQAGGQTREAPQLNLANPAATSIDGSPITVTRIDGASSVIDR